MGYLASLEEAFHRMGLSQYAEGLVRLHRFYQDDRLAPLHEVVRFIEENSPQAMLLSSVIGSQRGLLYRGTEDPEVLNSIADFHPLGVGVDHPLVARIAQYRYKRPFSVSYTERPAAEIAARVSTSSVDTGNEGISHMFREGRYLLTKGGSWGCGNEAGGGVIPGCVQKAYLFIFS